jgi:crotonobetainyl-CoA:carnitine CoA-transferase CaiB-like acyl-CoA transferase
MSVIAVSHALDDIKIVDFGMFLAGPVATRLLADQGAQVIKVEQPDGDSLRPRQPLLDSLSKTFYQANAGKRGIALDLKTPEGLAIAQRLMQEADVVANNFRPGVADRLGVGYEAARKLNPSVIYCFSPGFGSVGPRADKPGLEPLYSAFCGVHYSSGGEGNPPVNSVSFDQYCGLLASNAILMALYQRDLTGEGQFIEVTQLAQVLYYTSEVFFTADGTMPWDPTLDCDETGYGPLNRLYQTQDDWLCIGCWTEKEWTALCSALEMEDVRADPRFESPAARSQNGDALADILIERLLLHSTQEWVQRFEQYSVPFEVPTRNGEQLSLENAEYLASGLVAEHQHPVWGKMRAPGIGVRLSDTPGINQRPAPLLGQHTREILTELGHTPGEIEELRQKGAIV